MLPRAESKHRSLAFTDSDTFAYFETSMAGSAVPLDKIFEANPLLRDASPELQKFGLNLGDIVTTFGSEIALVSDWESGGLAFPSLFAAVEVRDAEKARKFADLITSVMATDGALIEKEHLGAKLWSVKAAVPLFQPTLALNGTHLMFGLNVASVKAALDHAASGKSALAESGTFTSSLKTVGDTNNGLAYVDCAQLLGRLYDRARPFITSSIASDPKISKFLDASLVPKTEVLTRHMLPFVLSLHNGEHGFEMESTGPVTYVTGVGGVAFLAGLSGAFWMRASSPAPEAPREIEKAQ